MLWWCQLLDSFGNGDEDSNLPYFEKDMSEMSVVLRMVLICNQPPFHVSRTHTA